jgi:hypothetical protein
MEPPVSVVILITSVPRSWHDIKRKAQTYRTSNSGGDDASPEIRRILSKYRSYVFVTFGTT